MANDRGSGSPGGDGNGKLLSSRSGTRTRTPAREREIIETAVSLFQERGYADTSVEDVAQAIGILKGSLYYYIDSKEDLLFRIVDDVHEGVQKVIDDVDARTDLGPLERVELYIREQVAFNARHIKEITVYHHEFPRLAGDRLTEIKRRRKRSEEWLIRLLKEAQEAGDLDPELNARLAAKCVFAPIVWMYTWYQPGRGVSAAALGKFVADFSLHGLVGTQAASSTSR